MPEKYEGQKNKGIYTHDDFVYKGGAFAYLKKNLLKSKKNLSDKTTTAKGTVKYEGQKNEKGQAHGLGIETTDEYVYKGEFEGGKKGGIGIVEFKDGTIVKVDSSLEHYTAVYGTVRYTNNTTYAGEIDETNFMPKFYGEYNFQGKQQIVGFFDKSGTGLGKVIDLSNKYTYLGDITNFKPDGFGHKHYNINYDYYGYFKNGEINGLGKVNNNYDKEEIIGEIDKGSLNGLGIKTGTRLETLISFYIKETGNFINNNLEGEGVRDYTSYDYVYYDENFKKGKTSNNYKEVYKPGTQKIFSNNQNEINKTTQPIIDELKERVQGVVDSANQAVQEAEKVKKQAIDEVSTATTVATNAKNMENKATAIQIKVDEAIQALKNAAIKSYKDKIDEVNPKKTDSKFAILEKNDHTYAGQVNDSNEPDGYGVKTYKDKQRKMEGIFKDNSFVFGKYTNGTKASSGFFNKEVLTGFGKNNDEFFSDIHSSGPRFYEIFSKKTKGKDKYLVAEIEKNLDNDVTKVVDQKAKPNANLAAEKFFKELMKEVKDYVDNNSPVDHTQFGKDEFFVGQTNGYGVRKYNKTIITGIFQRLVFKFGLVVEGEKKLYGFFEDENTPKICVDETGKPVDNQPFTDIHFLNHISLNLKGEAETAVKKAEDMKRDKEKEIADETEKAQKKAAQDFYDTELTSGTTHIPKSEVASTGHLKISESNYFGEINSSNQPHGFGELTLKNDNVYKGRFINGVKDGVGQLYEKKSVVSYSGFFKNDDKYDLTTGFTGSKDALKEVMKENEKIKIDPFIAKHVNPVIERARAEDAKIVAQTAAQTEYDEKITNVINAEYPDPHTYVYKKPIGNDFYTGGLNAQGKMDGLGKMEFSNGNIYEGSFKNGNIHGVGKKSFMSNTVKDTYSGTFVENKISGMGIRLKSDRNVSTTWSNDGKKKDAAKDQTNQELFKLVDEKIITDVDKNFVEKKVKPFLQKAKEQAIEEAKKKYEKKLADVLPKNEDSNQVYGIVDITHTQEGWMTRLFIGYRYKGNVHNKQANGYGILYDTKGHVWLKGFFKDNNFIFGTKTGEGSGFFNGKDIWESHLHGFGKNNKNQFSDTFTNGNLPSTNFNNVMFGENAALVEVIKDNVGGDLDKVLNKANEAVEKTNGSAMMEVGDVEDPKNKETQQKVDEKTQPEKEVLGLPSPTDKQENTKTTDVPLIAPPLTDAQEKYNKIINQKIPTPDHYVYKYRHFGSFNKYTGGVNKEGKPHGVGKLEYEGAIYEGTFLDGECHGLAKVFREKTNEKRFKEYYGEFSKGFETGSGYGKLGEKGNFEGQTNWRQKDKINDPAVAELISTNLKNDVEEFIKNNINEDKLKTLALNYAKKKYDEKLSGVKRNFQNLPFKKIESGFFSTSNYSYSGQVGERDKCHGYGVYITGKTIKTGIFIKDVFVFGKIDKINDEAQPIPQFLGFLNFSESHGAGYLPQLNKYTNYIKYEKEVDSEQLLLKMGPDMTGTDTGLVEVIKNNIKKDVDDVVALAQAAAMHANDPTNFPAPDLSNSSGLDGNDNGNGNVNKDGWKKTAFKAAAVGLGAAGIYYLYKKHQEYKKSKKSTRSNRKPRSSRSSRSNRRSKSKSAQSNRKSRSGSARSNRRSRSGSRRSNRKSKSKQRDRKHQSSRSSRKTRKSSQRSSE